MSKRYGFIYVDKDDEGNGTLKRIKKDSFAAYRHIIETNGAELWFPLASPPHCPDRPPSVWGSFCFHALRSSSFHTPSGIQDIPGIQFLALYAIYLITYIDSIARHAFNKNSHAARAAAIGD